MRAMDQPVLLAIDDDETLLGDIERELRDRYARHYQVVCVRSPAEARAHLADFAASGVDVALVLAGRSAAGVPTSELLAEVRKVHPRAKRALVVAFGDWGQKAVGDEIFEGVADGRFDHYVLRPVESPDELFHQTISSMLLEWWDANRTAPYTVHIVGKSWTGRAYELREALKQCAMVHNFCLADSDEGRALVAAAPAGAELPLVVFPNGMVLENPSNAELAMAAGGAVNPERADFDAIIVGAGPAGLSAAVYGASEGFRTLVVDQGGIGGQATSSSLIRNYLGFPRGISGRQLAQSAYNQAWVFGAEFVFMQPVAMSTSSEAPTRRGKPRCTSPGTPAPSPWWCGPIRSAPGCPSTSCARSRRPTISRRGSAVRWWAVAARDGSSTWCCATSGQGQKPRSRRTRSSS